jgi:hypothetical protein
MNGRVKMGDFRGFFQSPQLSWHRIVMVIGLKYLEDGPAAQNPLAVAAASYREAHRVGFAEPLIGVEVYLGHPAAAPLSALLLQDMKRGGSQGLPLARVLRAPEACRGSGNMSAGARGSAVQFAARS